jgi:hypothetical protein
VPEVDHVTRRFTLAVDEFGRTSLLSRASHDGISVERLVQLAALYYARELSSGRIATRFPRFRREGKPGDDGLDVQIELKESTWVVLDREAERQSISTEALLEHAAMVYLADLDSGRVAQRILEETELAEE